MKRTRKRLLSLLLCFCMVAGLLPVTAWAVDYMVSGEGWGIDQESGKLPTLYIESDQGMTDWIEIIDNPAELEKGEKSGNDVKIETGAPAGDQIPASELQDAA